MSALVRRLGRRKSSTKCEDIDGDALLQAYSESAALTEEVTDKEMKLARKIWDYMLCKQPMKRSDVILVLGNWDIRTAEYAARLWLEGWSEWLMFSGHLGRMTKGRWDTSEFQIFRDIAVKMGVPEHKILLEERATNTGENIRYSYDVLTMNGVQPKVITLIQTPFMERRTYATFMQQWPGKLEDLKVFVHSPDIPFDEYACETVGTQTDVIALMLGCLHRIREYPKRGYMIYQKLPCGVWSAYTELVATGKFSAHLLSLADTDKENAQIRKTNDKSRT